ncbi:ScyD/ScyE family protein [Aeromicrobium wangtongii]|uniref:ScyD/ScyE family protein n=1 Tax=Aeromicrobium wangtongii TaxID=2969247 RepID=UPI002017081E|nr:ScyD/ScyE family protein [Aeromicrobium wangtongii]MCL3820101.1 ScyD/ScyE family protein [Aeromicrobium wangtongii]
MKSARRTSLLATVALVMATTAPAVAGGSSPSRHLDHPSPSSASAPRLLAGGLGSGSGSTVGPDGALYVAEPVAGTIVRIDPRTGATSPFASGLPKMLPSVGLGGATDVAFRGHTAYALVTLVGPDVGGTSTAGLYRVNTRGGAHTVVADIGRWSITHPPATAFDVPSGLQFALQPWRGGFLVSDGHHNRILTVTTSGAVREVLTLGNVVPAGMDIRHGRLYFAEAGAVPHDPADGKIMAVRLGSTEPREVASGASILTDVELAGSGRGGRHSGALYAISNGTYSGDPAGAPGLPDTGSLIKANGSGGFDVVAADLDRPTSLEIIHRTAYVVTVDGEVWAVPLRH